MPKTQIQRFDCLLKPREKVALGIYNTSAARIAALALPKGAKVYDQTNSKWVIGDDTTGGTDEDS